MSHKNISKITSEHPKREKEILDENGRICTYCKIYKPWSSFGTLSKSFTGKKEQCLNCHGIDALIIKSKGSKNKSKNRKIKKRLSKARDPIEHRARDIRSKLMSRSEKEEKHLVASKDDIKKWLTEQRPFKCYYSGEYIDLFDCQVDHKIPVYKGGSNSIDNIALCTGGMNRAKGDMTDLEFIGLLGFISSWEDKGKSLLSRLKRGFIMK